MGLLGSLFNDAVEIVATPVKLVAKVTDDVLKTDIQEWIKETKDAIKIDED